MADNLQVNQGTGPAVRTLEDASSIHWPVGIVAYAQSIGTPDVLVIPTAVTLGDSVPNPQVLLHGACQLVFDGTQWVRLRGDVTYGLDVDVTRLPVSIRDFDTGAGTENVMLVGLAVPGSGGAQIVGTSSAPLRIDPTGTTTQPVSGTVSAQQSGAWNVGLTAGNNNIGDVDVVSLPSSTVAGTTAVTLDYDTGAGTQAMLMVGLALPSTGGAVAGGTQTNPIRVDPTGTTTQPVSGTVSSTQSGPWSVRTQDGAGNPLESATGAPAGTERGLIVRNIPSGTQTVSGNVNASQAGSWNVGLLAGNNNIGDVDVLSLPPSTVAGTPAVTLDYDTGAGTQQMLMMGIAIPAAGGAVAGGTATSPLRVDPTGTTTQPVSGTVTANQGGTWDINALAGSTVGHGSPDSGSPHKIGARASSELSNETPVATNQRTHLYATVDGRLLQHPYCAPADIVDGRASSTGTTDSEVIPAQGVGIRTYISSIVVSNSSATDVEVTVKNGTTARMTIPVPQKGGAVINLPVHLRGDANTAWLFASSAPATTITVTMIGYKSKV